MFKHSTDYIIASGSNCSVKLEKTSIDCPVCSPHHIPKVTGGGGGWTRIITFRASIKKK